MYLVLGSAGQLGKEFVKHLEEIGKDCIGLDREDFDVRNPDEVSGIFESVTPRFIINCTAYSDVDLAESHAPEAFSVNAEAPAILARAAKHHKTKLIHFSTDYVFEGTAEWPYKEDSFPGPINIYGESKLAGEKAVQEICENHLIIRTSRLFGDGKQNFDYKFLQWAKEKHTLKIAKDTISRFTSTKYLVEKTMLAIEKNISGLLHIAESEPMSFYDRAKMLAEKHNLENEIVPCSIFELNLPAKRPPYTVLDSNYIL
jgi:dTDP-4-dehydrorhamnose reductase